MILDSLLLLRFIDCCCWKAPGRLILTVVDPSVFVVANKDKRSPSQGTAGENTPRHLDPLYITNTLHIISILIFTYSSTQIISLPHEPNICS